MASPHTTATASTRLAALAAAMLAALCCFDVDVDGGGGGGGAEVQVRRRDSEKSLFTISPPVQVLLTPHCDNSVRVRIGPAGRNISMGSVGALDEHCRAGKGGRSARHMAAASIAVADAQAATVTQGNLRVDVNLTTATATITVSRVSDGAVLLAGPVPEFGKAACGTGFSSIAARFATPAASASATASAKWYGLGQLENPEQSPACEDFDVVLDGQQCGTNLNRAGQSWAIKSTKYHIAIPWLFDRVSGLGVFLNQPGDGAVDLSASAGAPPGLAFNFTCQRQLDMWVTVAPAAGAGAHPRTGAVAGVAAVYQQYAQATGLPAPLPERAALFWQCRDFYHNQSEVIALAKNFSDRGLPLGFIVVDLGMPRDPPYYRLDPSRFPDVALMARTVASLTNASLMPNLKPTSVASADCPACWPTTKHPLKTDGRWDDGRVDPSHPACRACLWDRRFKPFLFDRGIKAFWFDDDETDKFHAPPPAAVDVHGGGSSVVNCSGKAGVDFTGTVLVKGALSHFNGTTASLCCANCSAHLDPTSGEPDCIAWTYAPLPEPKLHHAAGSCWLVASYTHVENRTNRISGGQMTPPQPPPKPGTAFFCGPQEYCGMWMAGRAWASMAAEGIRSGSAPELENQPVLLSRNAWAGAAADGVMLWSSDILSTWKELRAQIGVGLSAGLSGIPFWSSDVGGFMGDLPTPELAARWHQFGSVCPLYRTHGARPYNEPWSFGPAAEKSITKSIHLRAALKPYILELAANASSHGAPLMRPLWWDFPNDDVAGTAVEDADTIKTFMFGPKFLAAPVLEPGVREITVYLPETPGGWTHYYSRAKFAGGGNATVRAPLDELALFERDVGLVPFTAAL